MTSAKGVVFVTSDVPFSRRLSFANSKLTNTNFVLLWLVGALLSRRDSLRHAQQ